MTWSLWVLETHQVIFNVSRNIYNVETTRSFEKKVINKKTQHKTDQDKNPRTMVPFLRKKNTHEQKKVMNLMNDKLIDNFNFYQPINSKIITLQIINSSPIVNHNTSTKSSCSSHVFTKFRITNSKFSQILFILPISLFCQNENKLEQQSLFYWLNNSWKIRNSGFGNSWKRVMNSLNVMKKKMYCCDFYY